MANISNSILNLLISGDSFSTNTVNEIKMIELSSWEWLFLLSITILVVWLLLLFQVRETAAGNRANNPHADHTAVSEEESNLHSQ